MRTTNLFVIANVKQLRTGGSFRILLPFLQTFCGVGVLNSAIFNSFQIGLSSARFWRAFGISGGGGGEWFEPPKPPPRYATVCHATVSYFKHNLLYAQNQRCGPLINTPTFYSPS